MSVTRPNVIFILADDLGYGDLSSFGNRFVNTPNIDSLGEGGLTLTRHYSASPLCAPARAALLTGRYNHRTGAVDVPSNRGLDRIALSEVTIADTFSAADYTTGMVGKWHNGSHDLKFHPNAQGFDEFAGFLNGGMDYYRWIVDRNGRAEPADGRYLTDVFTDEAAEFVRRHRSHPFFLFLSYNAPHAPFQAPEPLIEKYRHNGSLTEEVCRIYAMIERMDQGVGRVLEELTNCGLAERTIVVFTSDNGPYLSGGCERFNGPIRGAKGDVLEGGIRVPALIRWPAGLPAGEKIDDMTHFCDWLPTLASLAGVDVPHCKPFDGSDIVPVLRGAAVIRPKQRYWQRNRYEPLSRCNGAIRSGGWKLVWPMRDGADWKDPRDNEYYLTALTTAHRFVEVQRDPPERTIGPPAKPELYQIDRDGNEENDLSEAFPQLVAEMSAAWDNWFAEVLREWETARRRNVQ